MRYDDNECAVHITAEELCSLAHKSGDIDSRAPRQLYDTQIDRDIYTKIFYEEGAYYNAEIELSLTIKQGELYYSVDALADGVLKKNGKVRVDIIRKVRKYDFYAPPKPVFVSMLKCAAYFYAVREGLSSLTGRLYYVSADNESKVKHYDYYFDSSSLKAYYNSLIEKIRPRAELLYERLSVSMPSAESCPFPYDELREGQEIMVKESFSAIKKGKRLFLQAPTGTGKTVASLYPAVRALGVGYCDKVFYLTSKASTRREAFRGAARIFEAGAKLRTIVIGAKEQVCLCAARYSSGNSASLCNPIDCPYAAGYYDRCEDAIMELAHNSHGYTLGLISRIAKKYRVCPYELSLDLSELCDIIICDYNYVFDPIVYFRRYFSHENVSAGKYVFLVDEAHNLPDRAREMYSATLTSRPFEKIYSFIDATDREINEIFEKIILTIRSLRRLCRDSIERGADGKERGFYLGNDLLSGFVKELCAFKQSAEAWLWANKEHDLWQSVSNLIYDVKKYLCVAEYFDTRFFNYVYVDGDLTCVRIFCLDPSDILDRIQKRALSTIMFSATLMPPDYFSEILGGGSDAARISLPSPFDASNLCVCVAGYLSTRFDDREKSTPKYVSLIAATVSRKPGNYIAYFPSYDSLERVYTAFIEKYPGVDVVAQKRGMTAEEKEEFLNFFKDDSGILRVGFCVLGGSFSEGVDLPGARLIGTVVFGVGLPGLSNERNIMKEYYDGHGENGYDYAYTFPGMNNVLQAAGRVIRRDDDRGVVVLADNRYLEEKYKVLLPEHWKDVEIAENASEVVTIIQKFWKK